VLFRVIWGSPVVLREERSTRNTQSLYFRFCQFLARRRRHIFGGKRADFVTTLRTVNNRDLTVLNLDLQLLRELESAAPTL